MQPAVPQADPISPIKRPEQRIPGGGGPKGAMGAMRQWVYTAKVSGRFQRAHRGAGMLQLLIFLGLPWLRIGGNPALRVDLEARRLYAFGEMFGASDTVLLVLLLLFLAFSLFFFTAMFGRLWCGYLCPQTVFLEELIRPVETWIEGDRGQRMMRDVKGRWTADWAWRKAAKWGAFAAISILLGVSVVGYFAEIRELVRGGGTGAAWAGVAAFAGVMFLDFAWFREQFCNYLCPYARFQGALADEESLVVAYDWDRGEPRGTKRALKIDVQASAGACIDCRKCVAVCPAGIDIRNGFQLECINCARCVDACAGVMEKLEQPNLIRYTTIAADQGRPARWLRPRTVLYGGLLVAIVGAAALLHHERHEIYGSINRLPGSLYTVDADGWVRNTFLIRVHNQHVDSAGAPETFTFRVEGMPEGSDIQAQPLHLGPGASGMAPLIIRVPPGAEIERTRDFDLHIHSSFDEIRLPGTFKSQSAIGNTEHNTEHKTEHSTDGDRE